MRGAGSLTMRPGRARCRGLGTATGLWTTPAPEREVPSRAPTRPPPRAHGPPHPGARATTRTSHDQNEPRPGRATTRTRPSRTSHDQNETPRTSHHPPYACPADLRGPATSATHSCRTPEPPEHGPAQGRPRLAPRARTRRRRLFREDLPDRPQPCPEPPTPSRSPSPAPQAPEHTGTPAPAPPEAPPPCRRAPRAAARCWRRRPPGPRRGRRPRRSRRPRPGR